MVHHDVNLMLSLACNASANGVGVMISQVMENNNEKSIAYASCTLTNTKKIMHS